MASSRKAGASTATRPLWDVLAVALAALFFAGLLLGWRASGHPAREGPSLAQVR